jgi:hypothetical protein
MHGLLRQVLHGTFRIKEVGMRQIGVVILLLGLVGTLTLAGISQEAADNLSIGRTFGIGATISSTPVVTGIVCLSDEACLEISGGYWSGVILATGSFQYRVIDGADLDLLPYVSAGYWGVSLLGYSFGGPILGGGVIAEYSFAKALALRASLGATYVAADFTGVPLFSAFGVSYGLSVHFYFHGGE